MSRSTADGAGLIDGSSGETPLTPRADLPEASHPPQGATAATTDALAGPDGAHREIDDHSPDSGATRAHSADDPSFDRAEIQEEGPITDGATVAAQPTTTQTGDAEERETFIPLTRFAIREKLTAPDVWPDGNAAAINDLFDCLAAVRNLHYTGMLLDLKQCYLPFSPDRDTVRALTFSPEQYAGMKIRLTGLLNRILEGANYRVITPAMLEEIFEEKSAYGLDLQVDLAEFEELMVYSRGATMKEHRYRSWRTLWLKQTVEPVPIFQRLFLLLKLKDEATRLREIMLEEDLDEKRARKQLAKRRSMLPEQASSDFVYLKMFKQIPRADLQMMFPNTRVRFRLRDKLFLGATAGGGTIASIISTVGKLAVVASNPIKALGALVGLAAVVFRQVKKFLSQKNQYMMTLAQNLYFHNLADNRGVLTLLTDRAEEEDVKEDMLLYALLARGPLPRAELDDAREAIEQFLEDEFEVEVRFDAEDSLTRLMGAGLVREINGVLQTLTPEDGAAHLREVWAAHLAPKNDTGAMSAAMAAPVAEPDVANGAASATSLAQAGDINGEALIAETAAEAPAEDDYSSLSAQESAGTSPDYEELWGDDPSSASSGARSV